MKHNPIIVNISGGKGRRVQIKRKYDAGSWHFTIRESRSIQRRLKEALQKYDDSKGGFFQID